MADTEGVPLPVLFDRAKRAYGQLCGDGYGPSTLESAQTQAQVPGQGRGGDDALRLLEECGKRVRQLALFSRNEEVEDVATTDLKYLLIPYMQADALHQSPVATRITSASVSVSSAGEPGSRSSGGEAASSSRTPFYSGGPEEVSERRLAVLHTSHQLCCEFVESLLRLGVVTKREVQQLTGGLGSTDSASASAHVPLDPATKRAVKVARFKMEKELKQKLEALSGRRRAMQRIRLRRKNASSSSSSSAVGGEEDDGADDEGGGRQHGDSDNVNGHGNGDGGEADDIDESEERELWLLQLKMAWVKALELQQAVAREEELLNDTRKALQQQGPESLSAELTREQLDRSLVLREESHRSAAAAAAGPAAAGRLLPITCSGLAQDVIEGRVAPTAVGSHRHTAHPAIFGPASLIGGPPGGALPMGGQSLGQMSALAARQAAAARVFQPSHSLPRMSIEEAGLREMKMMEDWKEKTRQEMEEQGFYAVKEREAGLPGMAADEEDEEGEEDESDEAVMKARKWDDWKDDHPFGTGNSKRTPCG